MKRPAARPRTCAHVLAVALAGAAALAAPAEASAQACSFSTATGLAFGTYDPFAATPLDSTSQLVYRCPPGRTRVTLDAGSSGTFAARELRSGANVLRYNLYADAARTAIWGDGTGGSVIGPLVVTKGPSGTSTAYVFGRIPAGQDPVVGAYQDLIRVTFDL